jgi:ribonuclease J
MHGRKQGLMTLLIDKPPKGVDAMLLEGTTLSRNEQASAPVTESGLENEFTQCFKETNGLVMVQASAQNIDRLVTVYRACLKAQRTLVIDLYTALVLEATANPKIPQSHWPNIAISIPLRQRIQIKRNGWFEQLQRHSTHRIFLKRDVCPCPEKYILLFRELWRRDLDAAGCLAESAFVHSLWTGYLHADSFAPTQAWLEANQIPLRMIHTSGHADSEGLKKLAHAVAPKMLVPIHTTNPEAYNEFGIPVVQYCDGEWWAV